MTVLLLCIIVLACIGLLIADISIPECRWCGTDEHVYPQTIMSQDWQCHQCGRPVIG